MTGNCSVRLVICFNLAIDQIAQFGLSSLKGSYYSAQLYSIVPADEGYLRQVNIVTRAVWRNCCPTLPRYVHDEGQH
ncbi:hypothetical protein D0W59_23535 [Escherichia coli]|nr:hypothetical protein [Escherichia coli]EEV5796429.1 hypothetical protein [Escherichia coli]EEV5876706.1 hypothetical protein [Escherichia coli]EEV6167459.1 hypothetical protein [Escherichia coli]EEV6942430.1 hypothetical protein [Escherichia coli]